MLKKSLYTVEIKKLNNNEYLFYNTLSGALAQFDKETYDFYHKIESIDLENCKKQQQDLIIDLKENGFIVDMDRDEKNILKAVGKITRYNSKVLNLTIAPTTMCNMKCSYCFETIEKTKMDQEIMSAMENFFYNEIINKKINNVNITWFGGEPLLDISVIKRLSKYFITTCQDNEIEYNSSIITNGILLTQDIANTLVNECKISAAQITLDGVEDVHNNRRKYEKGNGFEIIMGNIMECKNIINIMIRINIDKENIEETYKLIDYLAKQKKIKEEVYVYIAKVEGDLDTCLTSKQYSKSHIELLEYLKQKEFYYSIERTFPSPSSISCSAVTNSNFVIDSLGNIYTCLSQIGCIEKRIGTVFNGIDINNNYSKWLNVECYPECNECSYLPVCNGGCPLNIIEGKSFNCTFNNEQYNKIISNFYDINKE